MTLKNPIPEPHTISEEVDEEIKQLILTKFMDKSLDFHSMTDFFESQVSAKDIIRAEICGYYCVNVIITNKNMTDTEKFALINSICADILLLKNEEIIE